MIPYGKRLAKLYAEADVLAMPSRNETFGLAVLEALASGVPVVAVKRQTGRSGKSITAQCRCPFLWREFALAGSPSASANRGG